MHVVARTALGLCLGGILAGAASAQEQSLDGLLASLNDRLRQNAYQDYDGKATVSRVLLPGDGTIVVEITKESPGTEVTNVFVAALGDLDLTGISSRQRDGFVSISLGARREVQVTLRCTTAAGTHEWGLPAVRELAVEIREGAQGVSELTQGFRDLIRRAKTAPTG